MHKFHSVLITFARNPGFYSEVEHMELNHFSSSIWNQILYPVPPSHGALHVSHTWFHIFEIKSFGSRR